MSKGREGNLGQSQDILCLREYSKRQGVAWETGGAQGWVLWPWPTAKEPKFLEEAGRMGQAQRGRAL